MKQSQFIKDYNDQNKIPFNPDLFIRDDNRIIEELKKVIYSSQRSKFFTIRVDSIEVLDDYFQVNKILEEYEETQKKNKKKHKENQFSYINLKDSDLKLMIIHYYIRAKDHEENISVLLAVPRIVQKYYFRISGNLYNSSYQIVEGSTYNNTKSASSSKSHTITLKAGKPIKIYRNNMEIEELQLGKMKPTIYYAGIFSKSVPVLNYLFAKMGYYETMAFVGGEQIILSKFPTENKNYYNFKNHADIYVSVPKYIFDNNAFIQNIVATLYKDSARVNEFEDIFRKDFWLETLGSNFSYNTVKKGISILDSLESIYDIKTQEVLKLPHEDKATIYHVLRWISQEFGYLSTKDNLDISYKRIRCAEYIASLYSMKLALGIYRVYRILSVGNEITLDSIKKAIVISPMYLVSAITKCQLINYRDLVNDLDSIPVLKYTYKGISGIGENAKSVPPMYRFMHESHLGRLDPDSSKKSDPGLGGILCPTCKIYDGFFSDYQEPNFWKKEYEQLLNNYKRLSGLKEVAIFKEKILGEKSLFDKQSIDNELIHQRKLIKPARFLDEEITEQGNVNIALEDSGTISYGVG